MSRYRDVVGWINEHRAVALDLVRIYLGVGLFVRGVLFAYESQGVSVLVDLSGFSVGSAVLAHYVTFAHLMGGLMLAVGLLTRLAALVQIPILAGAVFLVHLEQGLLTADQSLEFSALVLVLLVVVFIFGPGEWAADQYVFEREPELQDEDPELWWRDEDFEPTPTPEPTGGENGVAVASASAASAKELLAERVDEEPCACGHDLSHPRVAVEPKYGWSAGFFFMLGVSAPLQEVVFYCEECGTVMKRTRDAELLRRYRWHTS
ncbi:DoxX family protein [Salinibacter grassmerensis]|uniref:DoxX family protein n=1 Tax=Salinibacter grassmerensis TaxID=3040353 RepID=UPI0021E9782D|nr:DoxX family protein [Salinibacter grassmerensis]